MSPTRKNCPARMPIVLLLRNPDRETLQKPHPRKMPHKIHSFLSCSDPVPFTALDWPHQKVISLLYKCIHEYSRFILIRCVYNSRTLVSILWCQSCNARNVQVTAPPQGDTCSLLREETAQLKNCNTETKGTSVEVDLEGTHIWG